jgi:hypothetical protein
MTRNNIICASIVFAILFFSANSHATPFGINITIWDKMGSQSEREDNEVEPGDVLAQMWDLEGFYLNQNSLTMIGGFNFLTGGTSGSHTFRSGDIFISTNPGGVHYGNPPESYVYGNNIQNNVYGYDYVLDMDYANRQYQVYRINGQAQLESSYYRENAGSNPFRYASGGTPVGSIQNFLYDASPDITGLGLQGMGGNNFHNTVTVDLGFLPSTTFFLAHFAEECGNDNLIGVGTTVPEPAAAILFGTGLAALFGLRRYLAKKKYQKT